MLILITADPRASHRTAEAVRVAAGLAAIGELTIEVCFSGAGALVLSRRADDFVDGGTIARNLPILGRHAKAVWVETGDPFLEGERQIEFQRINLGGLIQITGGQAQTICF